MTLIYEEEVINREMLEDCIEASEEALETYQRKLESEEQND